MEPGEPEDLVAGAVHAAGSPAADARRLIIASTARRTSGRPLSRPARSMPWNSGAFASSRSAATTVRLERLLGPVVRRHVVPLPVLLVQPQPPARPLPEVVLAPHPHRRAHPREAVHAGRSREPGPAAPPPPRVDPVEERPRLRRRQHRRRPLRHHVLRGPGRPRPGSTAGPGGRQASRRATGSPPGACLTVGTAPGCISDVGRHVQRRDPPELEPPRAARQELPRRPRRSRPRPPVRDHGREELQESLDGHRPRIEDTRAVWSSVTTRDRRGSSIRAACRRCFRICRRRSARRSTREWRASSAPNVRISLRCPRPRHCEQALDVTPRQEIPVQPLKLPDRARDREHPPRLRGHPVSSSLTTGRTARPARALTPARATATDRREHLTQRARFPLDPKPSSVPNRGRCAATGSPSGKRPQLATLILHGPDPLGAPRVGPGCRRHGAEPVAQRVTRQRQRYGRG